MADSRLIETALTLRGLAERNLAYILELDKDGDVVFSRREDGSIPPEEVLGSLIHLQFTPEQRTEFHRALKLAGHHGGVCDCEFEVATPEGVTWWSIRALYLRRGGREGRYIVVGADTTARKEAELELCFRIGIEDIVTASLASLLAAEDETLTTTTHTVLGAMGQKLGVERAYILPFPRAGLKLDSSSAWRVREELPSPLRTIWLLESCLPYFEQVLRAGSVVCLPNPPDWAHGAREVEEKLVGTGIKAFLCVPLVDSGDLIGGLVFDSCERSLAWPVDVIVLVRILGEGLGHRIGRRAQPLNFDIEALYYKGLVECLSSGTIVMCSSCKRVLDASEAWVAIEHFLNIHVGALFIHTVCPSCMRTLYPEYHRHRG